MVLSIGVGLYVFKVAALVGKCDEVRKDHAAIADMEDWIRGTGFDVLGMVIVHASLNSFLDVVQRQHRFHVLRDLGHLLPLYLVVESPQRHCCLGTLGFQTAMNEGNGNFGVFRVLNSNNALHLTG